MYNWPMDLGHLKLHIAVEWKHQADVIIMEFGQMVHHYSTAVDTIGGGQSDWSCENPTFLSNVHALCTHLSDPTGEVVYLAHEWFGLNTHTSLDIISHTVVNRKEGSE